MQAPEESPREAMKGTSRRVTIAGWYGSANLGDELLQRAVVGWAREAGWEPILLSIDPAYTRRVTGAQAYGLRDLRGAVEAFRQSSLFVLGGGGLLQDYDPLDEASLLAFPARNATLYPQLLHLAAAMGLRTLALAQGVGPLRSEEARRVARDMFRAAGAVSVRDGQSLELLRSIGVTRDDIACAPDPVWALPLPDQRIDLRHRYPALAGKRVLAVNVRHWPFGADWEPAFVEAFSRALPAEWACLWVDFQRSTTPGSAVLHGEELATRLVERLGEPGRHVIVDGLDASQTISQFCAADAVLAMRLHAVMLGHMASRPVVAIEYDGKVAALGDDLGVPRDQRVPIDAVAARLGPALDRILRSPSPFVVTPPQRERMSTAALAHRDVLWKSLEAVDDRPAPAASHATLAHTWLARAGIAPESLTGRTRAGSAAPGVRPRADILNINFFDSTGERRYMGGAERYVLRLAALLRELGYEPRLLQHATRPFTREVDGIEVVGVQGPRDFDVAAMSEAMAPHVGGSALVIASPAELACALPEGPRILGINHGIWWDDPEQTEISGTMGREALFRALALCDAVVCVDSNFEHWIGAVGAASLGRLVHIANAVDVDEFASAPRRMEGPLRCLFPRRLCRERGLELLEPAFAKVWTASPEVQLHICGAGDEESEAKARAFVERSAGRARWSALTLDDMPAAYREADVALIPTVYAEGTSLSCLEAMASGNAVVATRVGGLAELVIDGFNGLAIDADADALAAAILRLDADRALARNLAARGREVSEAFGLAQWEARWRELVTDIRDGRIARRERVSRQGRVSRHASFDALAAELARLHEAHAALEAHRLAVEADRAAIIADRAAIAERLGRGEVLLSEVRAARDHLQRELGFARDRESGLVRARDDVERRLAQRGAEVEAYAVESAWKSQEMANLRVSVDSHVAAIAWLQGELRNTIAHYRARQRSPRALVVDAGYTVLERVPPLRRLVRAVVPEHTRTRVSVARTAAADSFSLTSPAASPMAVPVMPATASTPATPVGGMRMEAPAGQDAHSAPQAAPPSVPQPAPPSVSQPAPQPASAGYDVFCFANVAWATRYQRPHHLMRRMADDGHRVFYIIASRVPEGGAPFDVRRMGEGIYEISLAVDRMQNMYGEAMSAGNVQAMGAALEALIDAFDVKVAVSIVHLTYWTPLAFALREARGYRVVYDCMDEWADFPNIGQPLLDAERTLVEKADLVTVTAALLEEKFRHRARRCLLVRNGVDFDFFAGRCGPNTLAEGLKHPIIGYYGALAEWVDFGLIASVARAHPEWTFVLVGDVFVKDLAGLDTLPNVKLTGRRPYEEMPQYLYHFDVCLVPFVLSDVTHAVDPVKFYEYLSVGKPVVTVPLEELAIYRDYAYFAEDPEAFGEAISRALVENDATAWQRRMALARDNDWDARHAATADAIRELHPKVSIVVISFDNVDMTRACVDSIFRNTTWPNFELIIVDNASSDETRVWLRHLARTRPEVRVIFNAGNRGFAAANNQGVAIAEGAYYVLLNNDTIVPRGWLEPLLARLDDPAIGMVGPVTNFVGNEAKIEVDYRDVAGMEAFAARWMKGRRQDFDIAMLAMFCVAIRRATWERIGSLDESFGTGMFEDDDYSRRIQATGLRTVCVPASFVHHFGQASFKKLIATGEYDALWKRNQAIYEQKWGTWKKHEHRTGGTAER